MLGISLADSGRGQIKADDKKKKKRKKIPKAPERAPHREKNLVG